jgi:hypothetical protein
MDETQQQCRACPPLVIETVTPSVPLNQSNVFQYTRNCFDFGRRCFEVQWAHGRRAFQKYFRKAKNSLAILLDFS